MIKRLLLVLLLSASAYAGISWPLTVNLPETPDSVVAVHYYGGGIYETVRWASNDSLNHTWTIQENLLNQVVYNVYWAGYDSVSAWTFVRDAKTSYGATETWYLWGAKWCNATDSSRLIQYKDGVAVDTGVYRGSTYRSFVTTLYAEAGKYNEARINLYYPSQEPATWVWVWDMTDTAAGTTIGSGTIATGTVQGRLFLRSGLPAEGAKIVATAGPAVNLAVGTGTRYIVVGTPIEATADSSGTFSMSLATTGSFADTTKGFYTITCVYDNKEMFSIKDLWIGTGTINIADSLAGRTK